MPTNSQPWIHPDDAPNTYGIDPTYGVEPTSVASYGPPPAQTSINLNSSQSVNPELPSVQATSITRPNFVGKQKIRHEFFSVLALIFLFLFFPLAWIFSIASMIRIKTYGKPTAQGDFAGVVIIFLLSTALLYFLF